MSVMTPSSSASIVPPIVLLGVILLYRLSENVKVSFMSAEPQHDQISVCTVDAMRGVDVVRWLSSL